MKAFPQNPPPDFGMSDEDELDDDWEENCVPFGEPSEIKQGQVQLQIQSQLETLKDHVHLPMKSFSGNSHEEVISDDEENNVWLMSRQKEFKNMNPSTFGMKSQCGWSEAIKEAEKLTENGWCSSVVRTKAATLCDAKGGKGINRSMPKPKLSFRFQTPKEEVSCSSALKDEQDFSAKFLHVPEESEKTAHKDVDYSMTELLEDFQGGRTTNLDVNGLTSKVETSSGHESPKHSMADLLDGIQYKNCSLNSNSGKYRRTKGKGLHVAAKRSIWSLGDRTINEEDSTEALDCGESSDDEIKNQNLECPVVEIRRQTMADQFQEVLGSANVNDEGLLFPVPKVSGCGLFGRLQQVLQSDKEIERNFARNIQAGTSSLNESNCLNVKILSKYLDAKLTVCQCAFMKQQENVQRLKDPQLTEEYGQKIATIIFNSRVCSDVDLEVGSLIRIHPPWKEVAILEIDRCVILCTYFSQI